ncbi:hypothetical protein F4X90_18300, partial [Candidatus Poribacteria bacterium]|nr:hypothetical protein [Candidatus Poribacteria bacterium]
MNRRPSIFIAGVMTLVLLLIATAQVQAQSMEPTLPAACIDRSNPDTQDNWIDSVASTTTSLTVTLKDPPRSGGINIQACAPSDSGVYSRTWIFILANPVAGSHTILYIANDHNPSGATVKPARDYWVRVIAYDYSDNFSEWYYIRTKAVALTLNSAGSDNTYQSGDEIEVTATFGESVTVTGSPRIPFTVGHETEHADYESGSPGTELVFSYTVVGGDLDTDGIEIAANALENHGGSTINLTSSSTVEAALDHAAVTASANHKVDGGAATTATVPEFPADTITLAVAENTATGGNVGVAVTAVDRDRDTLTYSLSGTDVSSFDIDSASGQITVGSGTSLNYEQKNSYSVTVEVTDSEDADGNPEATPTIDDTIAVTISVTNVNDAPVFTEGTGPISRTTQENKAATSRVGEAVTATDEDGDTLTYSLSGTDASSFDIDSASGHITVGSDTSLDYETKPSYSVTVEVTDGKDDSGDEESSPTVDTTIAVEISVTNVEEPPESPTSVTVTGASTSSLAVSWTAPSDLGARLDGYDVRYYQGTSSPSTESQWIDHAHSGTGKITTISVLTKNHP